MDTRSKIVALQPLTAKVNGHKTRGERIVLANGCFDVLHVGHVRYLEAARREGDVLVVAINSDQSVRTLKGEGRPILPASARARLVAGLAAVTYVVIFEEADVTRLLSLLRPDIHAKGTDYTVETVPERETAVRLGIQIAIVGDPKQHSTRELLTRLRSHSHG
ncbi:MAG TPA: adenylyltransferase/cytidyltransferase family protein [Candidatus Acidoferrales bacterium]|jgi:rfaE bifunctional protein nucleotidyltransferase chain/domain|nr:adenylyltransferase/cytidyltransferase family protein [Candidatus Acidoferrales bacterium]